LENFATSLIGYKETTKPTAVAGQVQLYAKDKAGVATLYMQQDDGTETEIGPMPTTGTSLTLSGDITAIAFRGDGSALTGISGGGDITSTSWDGSNWTSTTDAPSQSAVEDVLFGMLSRGTTVATSDVTLTAADSGKTISNYGAISGVSFILPAVQDGLTYRFACAATAITSDANCKTLLHLDGNVTDSEGTPKTFTASNMTYGTPGKSGSGYAIFNGSNGYISEPGSADFAFGTADFCVEGWIYPTSVAAGALFGTANHASGSVGWVATLSSGSIRIEMEYGGSWAFDQLVSAGIIVNQWQHLAIARSSGVLTVYVDGVSKWSGSCTANITGDTADLNIGRGVEDGNYFAGRMDEIRISNSARHLSAFTPPTVVDVRPQAGEAILVIGLSAGDRLRSSYQYDTLWLFGTGEGWYVGSMFPAASWTDAN
jgi:hypothetical protein